MNRGPLISVSGTGNLRTISWQGSESYPQYDVWVTQASTGHRIVNLKTANQSAQVNLPPGTYDVWVKPLGGTAQPWSSPLTFSLLVNTPEVSAPSSISETGKITWTGPADGTFEVWVSVQGKNLPLHHNQAVTGNSYELPVLPIGNYTAWVRQVDSMSKWSQPVNFAHGGQSKLSVNGTQVSWTAFSDNAVRYELWVSAKDNADRIPIDPTFVTATTVDIAGYSPGSGDYRVWMRAVSGSDVYSQWSSGVVVAID